MRRHAVAGMSLGAVALLAVSAGALAEGPAGAPPATPALDAGAVGAADGAVPPSVTDASGPDAGPTADASATGDAQSAPVDAGPVATAVPEAPAAQASVDAGSESPSDVGFSFGLRFGYSIPFGTANGGPLTSVVQGVIPLGAEMGWFIDPRLYVGAYFLYGFGLAADQNNDVCSGLGSSGFPETCSATMLRFGLVADWHFRPKTYIDPWVGAGLGYDIINLEATDQTAGTLDYSASLHGFIMNLESGVDFKPLPYVGLGPYAELATGHYSSDTSSTSLHAWLTLGIRLRTNL